MLSAARSVDWVSIPPLSAAWEFVDSFCIGGMKDKWGSDTGGLDAADAVVALPPAMHALG